MTTEQKEAIDRLNYINRAYDFNNYYSNYDLDCIDIVLNLIQEQEKEINKYLEIIANKVIETAKDDLLTEKNIELEKKDKIIDELAKAFKQDDARSVEEIKQFYERRANENR